MRWKILSSTRHLCWRIWLVFTALIVCILLGQTFNNKYGDSVLDWWWWFGLNVLPGLSLIYISLLLNSNPAKAVPREVHRGLWLGTLCYMLLIFATILGQGWSVRGELSLNDYRRQSYAWLLPFQLILMAGYFLEFVRKESLFRPDARVIMQWPKRTPRNGARKAMRPARPVLN